MFELKIGSHFEANLLIDDEWPTRIVTLMSDDVVYRGPHHLYIRVSDVSSPTDREIYPMPEHLHRVLDFTRNLTSEDRLLVHCFAGQSRSTAIAIAILIQHGMNYLDAFNYVASIRDILLPNELFIRHIDDHFDLQNQLVEHVATHRDTVLSGPLPPPLQLFKL